jgi:hypothetical protein
MSSFAASASTQGHITGVPTAWLNKLQQHFRDGNFCDVIIRVTLQSSAPSSTDQDKDNAPPAKRTRSAQAQDVSQTAAEPSTTTATVCDIKCHALVLSSASDYFDRCLQGGWSETESRVINITREDDEDLKSFKQLLELSYTGSYIHDSDGVPLDRETRLRIAMVANEFEFGRAIDECVASLREGLTLEEEILCLEEEIPAGLQARPVVLQWKSKVLESIVGGELGPVHHFFEEAREWTDEVDESLFYEVLLLKQHIKVLSVETFGELLGSDALQVQKEEEAYYLLGAWLHQSPHVHEEERVAVYNTLVGNIRFHHISSDFLACVVACCPLATASGMALSFLQSAFVYRNVKKSLAEESEADLGAVDRGGGDEEWVFASRLMLEDVIKLEKGSEIYHHLGLAGGLSVAVNVVHEEEPETVGVYACFMLPHPVHESFNECLERRIGFRVSTELGSEVMTFSYLHKYNHSWGEGDFFGKPWEEVVYANSPYFQDGALAVKITVKKIGTEEQSEESDSDEDSD